jgi:hypothetical protein
MCVPKQKEMHQNDRPNARCFGAFAAESAWGGAETETRGTLPNDGLRLHQQQQFTKILYKKREKVPEFAQGWCNTVIVMAHKKHEKIRKSQSIW